MINESGDDAPQPSRLRRVLARVGVAGPRTNLADSEAWVNDAIERYADAFAALDSSSDGKTRQDHINGLCDLWRAAAELEGVARSMRSLAGDAHRRCVAADVLPLDVSGEELVLLFAAASVLPYWQYKHSEAALLASQRTEVEADRLRHRVREQFLACSPPSPPGTSALGDLGWLTAIVSVSLTRAELSTAALACRAAAFEFASSMQQFGVFSPAHLLERLPTSEEFERLAQRLERRAESR